MDLDPIALRRQVEETRLDLKAFLEAREVVRRRVREVEDAPWPEALLPQMTEWTGTLTVLGVLDLTIHAMERTLEELKQMLRATETGRNFRVVEGGDDGIQS